MSEKYSAWIREAIGDGNGYGKCKGLCEKMAQVFPELEVRKGLFHSLAWGDRQHFWLRDRNGTIVDPAGKQHPDGSWFPENDAQYSDMTNMEDEEIMQVVPTGKCMDCGEPTYGGKSMCSEACERSYMAYLNGGAL